MATRFIYSANTDGYVLSTSTVYATALTGAGLTATSNAATFVGQNFSTPNYQLTEGFIEFDTASSQTGAVSSATMSTAVSTDQSTTDFTINARIYDWGGGTLTTASWRTVSDLAALTLVATLTTVGLATGIDVSPPVVNSFADVALVANINSSGFTRIVLSSSRQESSTTPTGLERVQLASNSNTVTPPVRLSIVDTTTQTSQTINTGTTTFTPTQVGIHDIDLYAGGARPALSANQEGGGGGGGYTFYADNLTSVSNVTVAVGATQATANTAGTNTTWTAAPLARATGGVVSGAQGNTSFLGFYYFPGGNGGAAQGGGGSRGGTGGSASGNPSAAGANGSAGSGSSGGAAGTGANGGGSGGNGGNSGVAGSVGNTPGGGAGGGGNGADAGATGAAGRMVVYWYIVPLAVPDLIMAPLTHPGYRT